DQHDERAVAPVAHDVAATPIRPADDARDTANHRISARLLELVVVGLQVVDIEQHEADGMRVALRELPIPAQKLFEVAARVEAGEPILTLKRGHAGDGA